MFISGSVLTLALDGVEKSLMHLQEPLVQVRVVVVIPETYQQSLRRAILKILLKKTLSENSLSEILDLNGNWPVGQI
jgi:hypothetical protein